MCTSSSLKEAQQYDTFCRAQSPPIPFVYAKTAGVFGQIFCDFGPEFVVFDTNGAPFSVISFCACLPVATPTPALWFGKNRAGAATNRHLQHTSRRPTGTCACCEAGIALHASPIVAGQMRWPVGT